MSFNTSGVTGKAPSIKVGEVQLESALVVKTVKIIEEPRTYEVPIIREVEREQVRYVTKEESQIKYTTKQETTVKYSVDEVPTTKYVPKDEETIRYLVKDVTIEKPITVDKVYERPVIVEREFQVATVKDLASVQKLMELIPQLAVEVEKLRAKVESLVDYKLVEEEVPVPKITWVNTPVEKIVWTDRKVPRELRDLSEKINASKS